MWFPHTKCRACQNDNLVKVFSFGHAMALANDFNGPGEEREGFVPVEILFCQNCQLAQTSAVVDPGRLYSKYSYVTSTSKMMMDHFVSLWNEIRAESECNRIMEIGSNTGELLAYCEANGATAVLGIEPASNLAAIANRRGINTICEMYGASGFIGMRTKPDVILARHVFCHISDWKQFVSQLEADSDQSTLVVIEVPYLLDTIQGVEMDQFYLEHTSYLSLHAMEALLRGTQFHMHKVLRFPVHGGAVAILLRRNGFRADPHESVLQMLSGENITLQMWYEFSYKANNRRHRLSGSVNAMLARGKKVVGFGASAKSSVWVQACGFDKSHLAFICDNTPFKQGKLSPGTDIPIVPESELTRDKADIAINFAWQYHDEIVRKHKAWVDAGGVFINPHQL